MSINCTIDFLNRVIMVELGRAKKKREAFKIKLIPKHCFKCFTGSFWVVPIFKLL